MPRNMPIDMEKKKKIEITIGSFLRQIRKCGWYERERWIRNADKDKKKNPIHSIRLINVTNEEQWRETDACSHTRNRSSNTENKKKIDIHSQC